MSAAVAFSPAITPSAYAGPSVRGSEEAAMPAQTGSPASAAAAPTDTRTEVAELAAIDARVRAHEAAHRAAAGELARGGSFTYRTGPDGRAYAVAGEVGIDAAVIHGDPAATLAKMLQVERAALAPADPSPQ
ncbi:putative metalloprotease CJM1_0395 family protein, partial [Plasticicumulans sp.]|uniref:putative metalloprotease CJM1_0395 family protein n=1 Tax=Plasticicumulans sp. TaxID=2307179 RepID=UPI0032205520